MVAAADSESPTGNRHSAIPTQDAERPEHAPSSQGNPSGISADELAAKSAAAAASLFRQGRALLAQNEELAAASKELSKAVRSNPLGAIAIAFATGFIIALLTRG
jgi:ElaB/YqjD/DUF883 family membrane-anchored ribosome-binding protein